MSIIRCGMDVNNLRARRALRSILVATALLASVSVPYAVGAQLVGTGSRIRVKLGSRTYDGSVVGVKADTLIAWLYGDGNVGPTVRHLALRDVRSVDVSLGQHRHIVEGALLGVFAGAAGGAIAGRYSDCPSDCFFTTEGREAIGAMVFGAIGLVAGAALGAAWKSEGWRRINPSSLPKVALGGDSRRGFVNVQIAVGGARQR